MLLCASSPYARRGARFDAWRKHFGKDGDQVLVWHAPTRDMNPTVPQRVIDEAMERDPASAAAEYGAEFRSDIEGFVSRDAIEACVSHGVRERAPVPDPRTRAAILPRLCSRNRQGLAQLASTITAAELPISCNDGSARAGIAVAVEGWGKGVLPAPVHLGRDIRHRAVGYRDLRWQPGPLFRAGSSPAARQINQQSED